MGYVKLSMFVGLIALLVMGCKNSSVENSSDLDWGILSSAYLGGSKLINVKPNEEVSICGENPEAIAKAALIWAAAINRQDHLKLVPCNVDAKHTIRLEAAAWGMGNAPAWTSGMNITFNTTKVEQLYGDYFFAILLHEMGHGWGLCDQYGGSNNCDPNVQGGTTKVDSSVMGSTHAGKLTLTSDDIEGMRQLALRDDVSANREWGGALPDSYRNSETPFDFSGQGSRENLERDRFSGNGPRREEIVLHGPGDAQPIPGTVGTQRGIFGQERQYTSEEWTAAMNQVIMTVISLNNNQQPVGPVYRSYP